MPVSRTVCSPLGILLGFTLLLCQAAPAHSAESARFLITEGALASDWQYFIQLPFQVKKQLWHHHHTLGRSLKDWHWQWRIGWIRACGHRQYIQTKLCQTIMAQGEIDKALVVRSNLARVYGRVYAAAAYEPALVRLRRMYDNPQNYRRGQPLFITYDILAALTKIGGSKTQGITYALAGRHPLTLKYYQQQLLTPAPPVERPAHMPAGNQGTPGLSDARPSSVQSSTPARQHAP